MSHDIISNWWLSHPFWKIWVCQLGWLFPIYGKSKNSCSKPPTSYDIIYIFPILPYLSNLESPFPWFHMTQIKGAWWLGGPTALQSARRMSSLSIVGHRGFGDHRKYGYQSSYLTPIYIYMYINGCNIQIFNRMIIINITLSDVEYNDIDDNVI